MSYDTPGGHPDDVIEFIEIRNRKHANLGVPGLMVTVDTRRIFT